MGIVILNEYDFKKINKYIKTTKFFSKPVVSTPFNSMAFNASY